MKKIFCVFLVLLVAVCFSSITPDACAWFKRSKEKQEEKEHGSKEHGGEEHKQAGKEHGGKEHGGKEHGGATTHAEPTAKEIRNAIKTYITEISEETGTFDVMDSETGTLRKLKLKRIHKRVGKSGDYYYSCADFTDVATDELLDLDLDVEYKNGTSRVDYVRIHKVDGKRRYTYDKKDNRVPVSE